jgi:hypothetical protein
VPSPNVYKTPILTELDRQSRDWNTVLLAREALRPRPTGSLTPRDMVNAAKLLGYRLSADDELHVLNDWANDNGQGWFGDIFEKVLDAFRAALYEVGEHGPYLDTWWVEGVLPAKGAQLLVKTAADKVGLFILTSSAPIVVMDDK